MKQSYTVFDLERRASDRELQACLLEMLLALHEFCKKHNLAYYLSGGTLLGAVRHKGFIPWDDDIDVNMTRPDCEKLMQFSEGKIGKFTLVPPNNVTNTFSHHWKLYSDDILVSRRKDGGIKEKIYPAFIDIFPLEGLPNDYAEAEEHYVKINKLKRMARIQSFIGERVAPNNKKRLIYFLAKFYFNYLNHIDYHAEVTKLAKRYTYEDSQYIGVMMTNVHGIVERVKKSEYTPIIEMEFEGKFLQCPSGFKTYLSQLYGHNYMTVLPPHLQFSRHDLVPFISKLMT